MKDYSLFCTETQTQIALKLGAPIFTFSESFADGYRTSIYDKYCCIPPIKEEGYEDDVYADIPTTEQMINWLEEQGMFIEINSHTPDRVLADWKKAIYTFGVADKFMVVDKHGGYNGTKHYPTREKATIAAIDAALEYLSKNK